MVSSRSLVKSVNGNTQLSAMPLIMIFLTCLFSRFDDYTLQLHETSWSDGC